MKLMTYFNAYEKAQWDVIKEMISVIVSEDNLDIKNSRANHIRSGLIKRLEKIDMYNEISNNPDKIWIRKDWDTQERR